MQQLFKSILNPFFLITRNISDKARNRMVFVMCFFLASYFIFSYSKFLQHPVLREGWIIDKTKTHIVCSIVIVLLAIFSINSKLTKFKWNWLLMMPLLMSGVGILITGTIHTVGAGYRIFGLMLLLVYPCLYFVWNNRSDYGTLYRLFSIAFTLVGIMYFLYCVYLMFHGQLGINAGRCRGNMSNANLFSMAGAFTFNTSLYLLITERKNVLMAFFSAIGMGIGSGIILIGQSRISAVGCAVSLCLAIIFYARHCRRKSLKAFLWKAILVILCMAAFMGVCLQMVNINQEIVEEKTKIATENKGVAQAKTPAVESPKNTLLQRIKGNSEQNANMYTAGRIEIWKAYAKKLNLIGNDFDNTDWKALNIYRVRHAHNNFLEMGYRCGIPVAILFIVTELIAGIIALMYLFGNRGRKEFFLFPVIFMAMYALESMLDIATLPMERDAAFFFYLAMIPMMKKGANLKP